MSLEKKNNSRHTSSVFLLIDVFGNPQQTEKHLLIKPTALLSKFWRKNIYKFEHQKAKELCKVQRMLQQYWNPGLRNYIYDTVCTR